MKNASFFVFTVFPSHLLQYLCFQRWSLSQPLSPTPSESGKWLGQDSVLFCAGGRQFCWKTWLLRPNWVQECSTTVVTRWRVLDGGHFSLWVSYAQEDTPKAKIPAVVGRGYRLGRQWTCYARGRSDGGGRKKPDSSSINQSYINTNTLCVPRQGVEVASYMKECMVEDWNIFEKVLDYS
jgi:Actin